MLASAKRLPRMELYPSSWYQSYCNIEAKMTVLPVHITWCNIDWRHSLTGLSVAVRGRVDDSFFDYLSPFCFSLIEFHCTFSISYKMLQFFGLLLLYFLIRMWYAVWISFFSCLLCFFPYSRLSSYILRLFLYLISFLLFPCSSVWENTRAWVPHFL